MTCVVAIKTNESIVIGADSAASGNNRVVGRKDKKIFVRKNITFGFAGSFRVGQLLKYQLRIPKKQSNIGDAEYIFNVLIAEIIYLLRKNKLIKNNEMDCTLVIIYNDRIYKVDSDFQNEVTLDDYTAIGDGADVALGALYISYRVTGSLQFPNAIVKSALEASAKFCTTVAPPFNLLEIPLLK